MTDPTPDEIARAKRWAAMQTPKVTTEYTNRGFKTELPHYVFKNPSIVGSGIYALTESAAWSALALALRPVFASVAPVIREECAAECDALASVEGIAQQCAAAIRGGEGG